MTWSGAWRATYSFSASLKMRLRDFLVRCASRCAHASPAPFGTPDGRNGELDDLRGAAVFLASRASDYVTGQTLFIDGGFSAG